MRRFLDIRDVHVGAFRPKFKRPLPFGQGDHVSRPDGSRERQTDKPLAIASSASSLRCERHTAVIAAGSTLRPIGSEPNFQPR